MKEGFYWIQYNGLVQMALFLSGYSEHFVSDGATNDCWLIDGGHEIDHNENVKVVNGPLKIID